jgi:hypothetical protein
MRKHKHTVDLAAKNQPTLAPAPGSDGVIKSFILPGNATGVMFVGSFDPDDFNGFQRDVDAAITHFLDNGVVNLLIDLTNNGGECYRAVGAAPGMWLTIRF